MWWLNKVLFLFNLVLIFRWKTRLLSVTTPRWTEFYVRRDNIFWTFVRKLRRLDAMCFWFKSLYWGTKLYLEVILHYLLIYLLHSSSDLIVKAKWQGKESWFFVVTVSVPLCMSSHQVSFQKKRISWSDNFIVITYDHFRSLEMILPTTKMNSQTSSVCHVYHCRCDSSKTETFLNFIITWRPFSVLRSSTASEVNYAIYFPQGCCKRPCSSFPEQNEDPCCSWHWKRRDWVYL